MLVGISLSVLQLGYVVDGPWFDFGRGTVVFFSKTPRMLVRPT
jgi:hypothetical protein